jgi:hypothetical protein
MKLPWQDYAMLHAPFIALAIVTVVGAIYTAGHEAGKRAILRASLVAAKESVEG